ncbi:MAG: membrane dipeptidase [Erythrobacter sp. 34-65-8]|nr:MAG: membrane dipeptidase [Erythrobacter sp. 34-65-8]
MKSFALASVALIALAAAPASASTPEQIAEAALKAAPVFDGHNDLPNQLRVRYRNVIGGFDLVDTTVLPPEQAEMRPLHTDLTRLRKGRVGAQFWSVYVPANTSEPEAIRATLEQIDVTKRLIASNPRDLQFALTARDVEASIKAGRIASLLGIEGGHSIGDSLAVLRQMHELGVRYMTLTHSRTLSWVDSATDTPKHGGLNDFGRAVIREMNRLGMLVDLSHVSEEAMHDVLDVAKAPVIFSHSGARAVNGHARNVPDSVLSRLPRNGGVVMVVGLPGFLSEPARQWFGNRQAEKARLEALWLGQPKEVEARLKAWDDANPLPLATISDMADHVDHVRKVAGIDHIGIGGDYDGMPTGPVGMEDVAGYPALFVELARRGYSQADLEKISLRNALRAMRQAETYAASVKDMAPVETPVALQE